MAWYCYTRRWPQELIQKLSGGAIAQLTLKKWPTEIKFIVNAEVDTTQSKAYSCKFNLEEEAWIGRAGRPVNPGLVIDAMVDGAFVVWDPARDAWKPKGSEDTPTGFYTKVGFVSDPAGPFQLDDDDPMLTMRKVLR